MRHRRRKLLTSCHLFLFLFHPGSPKTDPKETTKGEAVMRGPSEETLSLEEKEEEPLLMGPTRTCDDHSRYQEKNKKTYL